MLDVYQLQVFLAVAETGSYSAAAQRLHLTQPAVSRQMRLLQEQLGVHLFRRVGRRALPSHAGERLVEIARQVLVLSRRAEEEMAFLRGEAVGTLRVGGSGAPAWYVLSRLLPAFRVECPGVGFHLQPLPPEGVGRVLREGLLDLVVTEEEVHERGLACELLVAMETVLIAPPDTAWGQRKRLPLRKLGETPLILPARGAPARCFLEESMQGRGQALPMPVNGLEIADPGVALALVAAGAGTALLPRPLVDSAAMPVHTIILWPGLSWPFYMVRRMPAASRVEELFSAFALGKGRDLLR
jgi:DNA-binding transcriptional LysR family regulator